MMVAKIPVVILTAENKSVSGDVQNDGQAFASVLDQKKAAQAPGAQLPWRSLPSAHLFNVAESATQHSTDTQNDEKADITGESLLALLNQTQEKVPGAAEEKKNQPSGDESDVQNVQLPPDVVQPLPLIAGVDSPLLPASAELPCETTDATLETLLSAGSSANNAENNAASTLSNNAKPEYHPILAANGKNEQEVTQIPASVSAQNLLSDVSDLKMMTPQLESNPVLTRGGELSHEAEQVSSHPEFNVLTAPATQSTSTPGIDGALNTGVLTQEMGTPAWQQSLGQQLACFTRNGVQHAELRLHPEDLGSLQINLQLKNEQVQLHFVAESHQVRAAIEAAVPHLRTSLAESGIELGQSSIGAENSSPWNDPAPSDQNSRKNFADQDRQQNMPIIENIVENTGRTVSYRSGINTFA